MAGSLDFTIRKIEAISPPAEGRAEYKDTKEAGLYLRVTSAGVMTFSFVGRAKGSRRVERLTLGKYPQVKPEEARRRAREISGRLASGVSVATAAREKRGEMTVGELWDLYHAHLVKTTKTPGAAKVLWDTYVSDRWSKRRLSEVAPLEVEGWHLGMPAQILKRREREAAERKTRDEARRKEVAARQAVRRHGPDPLPQRAPRPASRKVTGKVTANRSLALLRAMFNFALQPKRRFFTGLNPAAHHKHFQVNDRDRFIQPSEFGPFFEALMVEPNEEMRDAILMALLTGQRRANVITQRWSEINFDEEVWRIAGELTKNGVPHTVPLGPEALAILKRRAAADPKGVRAGGYVFASTRSKTGHIGPPKSAWARLMDKAELTDLVLHDLRRTFGSWLARGGASLLMIGKSLNHKSPEATQIYARLDLDPIRQSMEGATSAMLQAAGLKPTATVHQLTPSEAAGLGGTEKQNKSS